MPPNFDAFFRAATGNPPFPWQTELYNKFAKHDIPSSANLPTGLGKTSVVAIWLIALALHPERVSRRLIYVVNRRTVVDQTTTEVLRLCDALIKKPELAEIRAKLADLTALPLPKPDAPPLAVSTLRGQFADNGEWCADPTRPAVVVGTVDMIGSGLLFSRYTRGFKVRPLHAGFLAQDALLVHDEAHLEPSFQKLLESVLAAQQAAGDPRPLRLLELSATSRTQVLNGTPPFTLTDADRRNEIVDKRINASKRLSLIALSEGEKLDVKLASLAAKAKQSGRAVLVFVRSVETAMKVAAELDKGEHKGQVATLTGTMRGKERDALVECNGVFQRFLPPSSRSKLVKPSMGTVFLVATSAGEVGINISADDLVCDLSTYESMAQRFGRVNRFGDTLDCTITVVHETDFDTENSKTGPLEIARQRTLALLEKLGDSASPVALDTLRAPDRAAAFSPQPEQRIATAIQFDAWALTSIREPIAARPSVAPYLHGEAKWQPPETHLAWRDDRDFHHVEDPESFLEDCPLQPAELLRDTTSRIVATLAKLLDGLATPPVAWLIAESGSVTLFPLSGFDKNTAETALADATLVLPTSLGGLAPNGLFNGKGDTPARDVSGIIRHKTTDRDELPDGAAKIVRFVEISDETDEEPHFLLWCEPVAKNVTGVPITRRALHREPLDTHTKAVSANAAAIAAKIFPTTSALVEGQPDLRRCLVLAAHLHDFGKNRTQWQRNLGNFDYDPAKPETILAKSAPGMRPRNAFEHYRHEFGSLNDAARDSATAAALDGLSDLERDIVLHLVAAHHGRARPHFPEEEIFDYLTGPDALSNMAAIATETPRRFARLQKRFGRWGLAWLESLLRAADYAASAGIVATSDTIADTTARPAPATVTRPEITPSATLALNPSNPGHYFACCGLFEIAAVLAPDAQAWFAKDGTSFHLANTLSLGDLLEKITAATITAAGEETEADGIDEESDTEDDEESDKEASAPPLTIGAPFGFRLDWWTTPMGDTSALKVWAGSMKVLGIARSMSCTVAQSLTSYQSLDRLLFETCAAYDPAKVGKNKEKADSLYSQALQKAEDKQAEALKKAIAEKSGEKLTKENAKIAKRFEEDMLKAKSKRNSANLLKGAKKEPFYFDANRGPNAHSRDVGFAINDLKWETLASPAVEFLTLVGLQRATPAPVPDTPRNFDYHLWTRPLPISLLSAAVNGLLPDHSRETFRFESWFRTGQRKHKAFLPARTISSL